MLNKKTIVFTKLISAIVFKASIYISVQMLKFLYYTAIV